MSYAIVRSIRPATFIDGSIVDVQADVSSGFNGCILIGKYPDALAVTNRLRVAIDNSDGLEWPSTRRTTALISPADLDKPGAHYDLALAVAIVAAHLQPQWYTGGATQHAVFVGELDLAGNLHTVNGIDQMIDAAIKHGYSTVYVPAGNKGAVETYAAKPVRIVPCVSLQSVVDALAEVEEALADAAESLRRDLDEGSGLADA